VKLSLAELAWKRFGLDLTAVLPRTLRRLIRFGIVGGMTGLVQIVMLEAFKSLGFSAVAAYALGLIVSCQFNFTLNSLVVWGDRPLGRERGHALTRRWASYHACIAFAVGVNFIVFVIARGGMPDIGAALTAIACSTLIKFLSLDRLAFRAQVS
jgi:putative flippase GtrA